MELKQAIKIFSDVPWDISCMTREKIEVSQEAWATIKAALEGKKPMTWTCVDCVMHAVKNAPICGNHRGDGYGYR